jgi:hypothetical protein
VPPKARPQPAWVGLCYHHHQCCQQSDRSQTTACEWIPGSLQTLANDTVYCTQHKCPTHRGRGLHICNMPGVTGLHQEQERALTVKKQLEEGVMRSAPTAVCNQPACLTAKKANQKDPMAKLRDREAQPSRPPTLLKSQFPALLPFSCCLPIPQPSRTSPPLLPILIFCLTFQSIA